MYDRDANNTTDASSTMDCLDVCNRGDARKSLDASNSIVYSHRWDASNATDASKNSNCMDAGIAWDASKNSVNASNSMNTSRDATNRWDSSISRILATATTGTPGTARMPSRQESQQDHECQQKTTAVFTMINFFRVTKH
jgi:hypothetical protein